MIELAALAWEMSPEAAMRKLAEIGFPLHSRLEEGIQATTTAIRKRKRWSDIWRRSQEYMACARSDSLAQLRTKFRLTSKLSLERWTEGPGRLIGSLNYATLEQLMRESSQVSTARGNEHFLLGKGWRDVLLLPYFFAPAKLAGLQFIGRLGRIPHDSVFKTLTPAHGRDLVHAGWHGLQDVKTRAFGNTIFITDDALFNVRLQIRHAATSKVLLPLAAYIDQGRYRTMDWSAIRQRDPIFVCWRPTPSIIWQAMQCDGRISIIPVDEATQHTKDHYVRLCRPMEMLTKVYKRAKPWRVALREWAAEMNPGPIEELMLMLETYKVAIAPLVQELGPPFADTKPLTRTLYLPNGEVIEKDGSWYFISYRQCRSPILFSEAILRIDYVIQGKTPYYQGRVLFRGRELPFKTAAYTLERYASRVIRATCLTHSAGLPKQVNYHQRPSLVEVALAFHKAQEVAAEDHDAVPEVRVLPRTVACKRTPAAVEPEVTQASTVLHPTKTA